MLVSPIASPTVFSFTNGLPRDPELDCCGHDTEPAGACFSPDGRFRYGLWRRWDDTLPPLGLTLCNPSLANKRDLDQTVNKAITFAHDIGGFGGIEVTNVYPLVSPYPKDLMSEDRDGDWAVNAAHIVSVARRGGMLLLGFGAIVDKPHLRYGVSRLRQLLTTNGITAHALAVTKDGLPGHPLYLKSTDRPKPFTHWPSWTDETYVARSGPKRYR